ncbi:MAG: hypothetical protein JXL85_03125, partial [Bacilli bacterium]|nr:hypothetical protein [Bacilli bacterium]
ARTQISENDIYKIKVPKAYLSEDTILEKDQMLGMYVKIDASIPKGSLIYQSTIESLDESIDQPSLLLRTNQAVYAIDVSLTSTSGNTLQIGSKVDIYGTLKVGRETKVDLLFKQVRVISVKDKNGNEVDRKSNQMPKLLLVAFDQIEIPLITKLIAMGEITITPTAEFFSEDECVLNEQSLLLEILYA